MNTQADFDADNLTEAQRQKLECVKQRPQFGYENPIAKEFGTHRQRSHKSADKSPYDSEDEPEEDDE